MSTDTDTSLVHLDPVPPCGSKREKGILVTGDPSQVTCPGCKDKKKSDSKKVEERSY